jgi:hypothetical protein
MMIYSSSPQGSYVFVIPVKMENRHPGVIKAGIHKERQRESSHPGEYRWMPAGYTPA